MKTIRYWAIIASLLAPLGLVASASQLDPADTTEPDEGDGPPESTDPGPDQAECTDTDPEALLAQLVCRPVGDYCYEDAQCCSRVCQNGLCAPST